MEKIQIVSLAILGPSMVFWLVALGGLGGLADFTCSQFKQQGNPRIASAKCAQTFGWEWWVLFYELILMGGAFAATLARDGLIVARHSLSSFFSIGAVLLMVTANADIKVVWEYSNAMAVADGGQLDGGARRIFSSTCALLAGFVVLTMLNLVWLAVIPLMGRGGPLEALQLPLSMKFTKNRQQPPAAASDAQHGNADQHRADVPHV